MKDCIVIGSGIVGATISRALRSIGMDVTIYDSNEPLAGTKPSGGHLKPSWLGMPKEVYQPSLDLLHELWGWKEEVFDVKDSEPTTVYRVDMDVVVSQPRTLTKVARIEHCNNFPKVIHTLGEERCRLLIIAAGVWSSLLLPTSVGPQIKGKQGVSFRVPTILKTPFIAQWAPYKQIVAHQQNPKEVWIGDGTAILMKNWNPNIISNSLQRCSAALRDREVEVVEPIRKLVGIRPVCEVKPDEPCFMKQVFPKVWIVTGASKRGTIAAGWAASILKEKYRNG